MEGKTYLLPLIREYSSAWNFLPNRFSVVCVGFSMVLIGSKDRLGAGYALASWSIFLVKLIKERPAS